MKLVEKLRKAWKAAQDAAKQEHPAPVDDREAKSRSTAYWQRQWEVKQERDSAADAR